MKNITLYNEPLRFECIPICLNQKDRLTSICDNVNELLSDFESDTLLRFYTSYGQTTDQVTWLMFTDAGSNIKKILPDSCFVIRSPEIVKKILLEQGFEELILARSESVDLNELLLISPSDKINEKALLLNLMQGDWTRYDFSDEQGIKEVLLLHDEADELQFVGNNRMILPKGVLTLCTLDQDSFQSMDDSQIMEGFQINRFRDKFIRLEFYKRKNEKKRISAIRFF